MTVRVRSGGVWVDVVPRIRSTGAWSGDTDSLYIRDTGSFVQVHPDPSGGPGALFPPEAVTVDFLDYHSVEVSWTNPAQPFVTPTEVQFRIVELYGPVFDITTYPSDGFAHGSLSESTAYQFQVRYARRVDGDITHLSSPASVFFDTPAAPISVPADDPGGGGGSTIIPIGPTNNPGPVGGSLCWWEWKLQVFDMEAWGWVDTSPLISGSVDGDDDISLDLSSLIPGTYRIARRENCNGVTGAYEYGDPFPVPTDWGAACAGILPSTSSTQAPYTDAVWQIPHVCTATTPPPTHLAMFDGVSNLELARGGNYGFVSYDRDGEWGIVSDSASGPFNPSPSVYLGALPVVPDVFAPGEDWTVAHGFEFGPDFASHSAGYLPIWNAGGVHTVSLLFGPTSCQVHVAIRLDDGSLFELDSTPVAYTVGVRHTWVVRWIDGGLASLWLNDVKRDEDTPATGIYDGPVGVSLRGLLPDGMRLRKQYGWDRALTDAEISPPPPISLAMVGSPFTSLNIPYFGDFDLATQHLIVGDVGNGNVCIIDCSTNSPTQLSATFVPGGYYSARWGVTNVTAFYFTNSSGSTFDGLIPLGTANHAAPSVGTLVQLTDIGNFFRHGSRILALTFSSVMHRYTISGGIPTHTGQLAGVPGAIVGHPNDPDTVFSGNGASVLSIDISGATPTIRQTFAPGGGFDANNMFAVGNVLYVLGAGRFQMVNIADPDNLVVLGTLININFHSAGGIAVEPNGKYAYITNGAAGSTKRIDAIDCRNPAAMAVATSWTAASDLANPLDIFYDSTGGDRLIVISQQPKIQVFAITR